MKVSSFLFLQKENKYIGGCKHQRKGGNEVWISDKCTFTPKDS